MKHNLFSALDISIWISKEYVEILNVVTAFIVCMRLWNTDKSLIVIMIRIINPILWMGTIYPRPFRSFYLLLISSQRHWKARFREWCRDLFHLHFTMIILQSFIRRFTSLTKFLPAFNGWFHECHVYQK